MCTVQLPQLKIVRAWIDPTWQGASRASGGCRDYIDSCESRIDNYGGVAFLRLACNNYDTLEINESWLSEYA